MEFIKTQENGDATSNYNIITDKKTVIEFLYELRKEVKTKQEWGDVHVGFYKKIATYERNGAFHFTEDLNEYSNKPIKRVWANGGWGLMSYYIIIEE